MHDTVGRLRAGTKSSGQVTDAGRLRAGIEWLKEMTLLSCMADMESCAQD